MKKMIKLAVVGLTLGVTSAYATNGLAFIGSGAKSRAMGGTGIANAQGAESGFKNPALITSIKNKHEISFGGTIFQPNIETDGGTSNFEKSDADIAVTPTVSLAYKVTDNWYWGLGMYGAGGLGTDYRNDQSVFGMVTTLGMLQFAAPIAYTNGGLSIGVSPILQYTALDVDYDTGFGQSSGTGIAQDLALGWTAGIAYGLDNGLSFGATYKSEIEFNAEEQISNALAGFGITGAGDFNKMEMPQEYGIGIAYTQAEHTITFDYRWINYEDAAILKDFGWEDQDVFAIGYEYATDGWALRTGYQYAKSAVQDNTGKNLAIDNASGLGGRLTNTFNQLGFPGSQESHITVGGSYTFTEALALDAAFTYGIENEDTLPGFSPALGAVDITSKHQENTLTIQLTYGF